LGGNLLMSDAGTLIRPVSRATELCRKVGDDGVI
jgi:hypothetical protein